MLFLQMCQGERRDKQSPGPLQGAPQWECSQLTIPAAQPSNTLQSLAITSPGDMGERKVVTPGKLGNLCPSQPHSPSKQEPDTPQRAAPGDPLARACSHSPGGLASICTAG